MNSLLPPRAGLLSAGHEARVAARQPPPARALSGGSRRGGHHELARSQRLCSGQRRRTRPCTALLAASPLETLLPAATALQRDGVAALLAAAGALLCIKTCDKLAALDLVDRPPGVYSPLAQKLTRKLVHIICGPGFVFAWLLFSNEPSARYVAALVPFLNGLRLVAIGTGMLPNADAVKAISRGGDADELLRGPLYYVIVMVFVTLVFWRDSPVGIVAISLMCGGDGLADVVGRKLGRANPLPFNPSKSVAGSVAMFLGSFTLSLATLSVYAHLGAITLDLSVAAPSLALICAAAAAVEAAPLSLDDNVSVPGVALIMASLML